MSLLKDLITAGTGVSSSRVTLLLIALTCILLLLILGGCLIIDIRSNGYIRTNLAEAAAFIGSLTTLLASVCFSKAIEKTKKS